ncbi:MAG TPA: ELWxxDGT repeat protein [Thermoanaerobaculia bacterium]|nr:ELWxxDGT repeat protein [Thermoanaerobaculia bacterium]
MLLVSDGTRQGTGTAFGLGSSTAGHSLVPMGVAGGRLLFSGLSVDGSKGELWATDGTPAGTGRLLVFPPGPGSSSLPRPALIGQIGGALVFSTGDKTGGEKLWVSSGTAAGTLPVFAGAPGFDVPGRGVVAGGKLLFQAANQTTGQAWVSDGTPAGTRPLPGVSFDSGLTADGTEAFFVSNAPDSNWGIWKSDGTVAGTTFVVAGDGGSVLPYSMTAIGGRLFFGHFLELWTSDGTAAGTLKLGSFSSRGEGAFLGRFTAFGNRLGFIADDGVHGLQPWVSDGTPAGTHLVAELHPGPGFGSGLGTLGGRWLFDARDSQGWFLWSSDGTSGISRIAALDVQTSLDLVPWADLGGSLLFLNSTDLSRLSFWRSDGSASGTFQVEELPPFSGIPFPLGRVGNQLLFSLNLTLWATDGTGAGTRKVGSGLEVFEFGQVKPGEPVFLVGDGPEQDGLFKIDGTDAGTVFLRGFDASTGIPVQFAAAGNRMFLITSRISNPPGLWTSDGTAAGTKPVATRHPLNNPVLRVGLGSRILFSDVDAAGLELWASDGTTAGTRRLKRIAVPGAPVPGAPLFGAFGVPEFFVVAGGRVFFAGDDGVHGSELWATDGTAAGTGMVADIARGASGSSLRSLTAVGRRVFFVADDGIHGSELWTSDGTRAGTRMVADIVPGARSSYPASLAAVDGLLLFAADDGVHGLEPWVSDGTRAGTRMLQDVAPGPLPSSPQRFFVAGSDVYFQANDAVHGFELWSVPREALHP